MFESDEELEQASERRYQPQERSPGLHIIVLEACSSVQGMSEPCRQKLLLATGILGMALAWHGRCL